MVGMPVHLTRRRPSGGGPVSTVIVKPTKECNADCTYCTAPPDGATRWTLADFERLFRNIQPALSPRAQLIWHGGEPMLMGPRFFREAYDLARRIHPGVRFSMQTNLLGYTTERWRRPLREIFESQVSTSFDPGPSERTFKGSTRRYRRLFYRALEQFLEDGFRPLVIGVYSDDNIDLAHEMYDEAIRRGEATFSFRVNYRYPAGRAAGTGEALSPEAYGRVLLELYERWVRDEPPFTIVPLVQMLAKTIGTKAAQCPWTKACGGRFFGIEPNGDVYNCSEFADLDDPSFRFGNAFEQDGRELLSSQAAALMRRRNYDIPVDCQSCRHFAECEGGCQRDAVLFGRGLGGKFYYCQSWKMVFDRLKESVRSGEADPLLRRMGLDPAAARRRVA